MLLISTCRILAPLLSLAVLVTSNAYAGESILTIQSGKDKKEFSTSSLLARKDLETVEVKLDPAYPGRVGKYKAVKASSLFQDIKIQDDAVIQFIALDGFAAPISKDRLLNTSVKSSIAYIAIENPASKWPELKPGKPSAGPFYLIWKNPDLSKISSEEWPYMLAAFEVKGTLLQLYPNIFPDAKLAKTDPASIGMKVFVKNCFACHTLNKSGASNIGPDLNIPMNPTEYLQVQSLRKLIRSPSSVRHWEQSRMPSFPEEILGEKELDHLIAYLTHMSRNKL